MNNKNKNINRRDFLKATTATAAGLTWATALKPVWGGASTSPQRKKVVIIGIDGMDPNLAQSMMDAGKLPAFDKLRREGGYSKLGTSTPPPEPRRLGQLHQRRRSRQPWNLRFHPSQSR